MEIPIHGEEYWAYRAYFSSSSYGIGMKIHVFYNWLLMHSCFPFVNRFVLMTLTYFFFGLFRALMGTQLYQLQQMKHSGFGKFLDPPIPQRRITLKTQKCLSSSFILTSAKNLSIKIYGITMNIQLKVVINVLLSLYKSLSAGAM